MVCRQRTCNKQAISAKYSGDIEIDWRVNQHRAEEGRYVCCREYIYDGHPIISRSAQHGGVQKETVVTTLPFSRPIIYTLIFIQGVLRPRLDRPVRAERKACAEF